MRKGISRIAGWFYYRALLQIGGDAQALGCRWDDPELFYPMPPVKHEVEDTTASER